MKFELIRHGQTEGNLEHRYIGSTDQDLCEQGRLTAAGLYARLGAADVWLISPMRRCLETACLAAGVPDAIVERLIAEHAGSEAFLRELAGQCPDSVIRIVEDLRECDFGIFENKNWQELSGDQAYQEWIDSNGQAAFPEGERPEAFRARCAAAFENQVRDLMYRQMRARASLPGEQQELHVRLVVHGGTIMSIMQAYALPQPDKENFYDWQMKNGEVLHASWDGRQPLSLTAGGIE